MLGFFERTANSNHPIGAPLIKVSHFRNADLSSLSYTTTKPVGTFDYFNISLSLMIINLEYFLLFLLVPSFGLNPI